MDNRTYEALYIVDPAQQEADVTKLIDKFNAVVTDNGGEIERSEVWERRRLAYEVRGKREGTYCLMYFAAPPAVPKELTRQFGITEPVLRARIYHRDKPKPVEAKETADAE